jgi:ribosomal protein S18 acetylase RimI-like enzyme
VAQSVTHPARLAIAALSNPADEKWAAAVMAASEPWLTLGIGLETSLRMLGDSSRERYLARLADQPAGFLILNMSGGFTGYVQLLGVAPQFRGQGVGRALIEFIEQRVFREVPNVFICVSDFNREARAFYAKLGYREVGELKDYVVSGRAEVLLRKSISPLREFRR